jgi:hypothetical protein
LHRADNAIAWIGADERGQGIAYKNNGYQPQRISNHAVEYEWSLYSTISDCEAWGEQHGGHVWSVFYFPTGDATWVYDHSTKAGTSGPGSIREPGITTRTWRATTSSPLGSI